MFARHLGRIPVFAVVLSVLVATLTVALSGAVPARADVPSLAPSGATPEVENGAVYAITEVGNSIVLGGSFTSASNFGNNPSLPRSYVLVFDKSTGQISTTFAPVLNGVVNDVAPGPTPGTVYVAGAFSTIDGVKTSKVVLLDVATGARVASFKAAALNGVVTTMDLSGSRLYVGGYFTTAGVETHGGLVALNGTTGNLDSQLNIQLAGRHNDTGSGAQGPVGPKELDVSQDGSRLVVVGNFKTADGLPRDQILQIDLTGSSATVLPTWRTTRYTPYCFNWAYDSYMRGVAFSPDGSYFVVTTTGGKNVGTLCDTASRFETAGTGDNIQPTWVDSAGGDTLWSVEITADAVYVGGHQRWMNNADGNDSAGQGAVPRPGLAALDTTTGLPLAWNPGRNPRGAAAFEIFAGSDGLYVGSDTEWIGDFATYRPRIARFPYAGGRAQASSDYRQLPGDVLVAGTSTNTLVKNRFDGVTAGAPVTVDTTGGWSSARGGFYANGTLYYGWTDGYLYQRSWDGRRLGTASKVDPYLDPAWVGVATGSGGTYDGRVPSMYGTANLGATQGMAYANERIYYARSNLNALVTRAFNTDSTIIGAESTSLTTPLIDFRTVGGMFISGGYLYYVSTTTGRMSRIGFDGSTFSGTPTVVSTADWRGRALWLAPTFENALPTAAATVSCADLTCTVDASGSTDPDGTVASYSWDFGDGSATSGLASTSHTYAAGGTYVITLVVTDDLGGSSTKLSTVTATAPASSNISFVGENHAAANAASVAAAVPSTVVSGDALVMFVSAGVSTPAATVPAGWALADQRVNNGLWSGVYVRPAITGDPGTSVPVTFSGVTKSSITIAAWRGASPGSPAALASSITSSSATHVSPAATAVSGAWVATYWADKSSATTAWTLPSGVTSRGTVYGTGTGRVTSALADGAAPVAPGTVGGLTATADSVSSRGISWTLVLAPKQN